MIKVAFVMWMGLVSNSTFANGGDGWFCEPWVRNYVWTYDWELTQHDGLDVVTDSYKMREFKGGHFVYDYFIRAGYDLESKNGEFNTYQVVVVVENKNKQLSCKIETIEEVRPPLE